MKAIIEYAIGSGATVVVATHDDHVAGGRPPFA